MDVLLAFAVDLVFGDPYGFPHPVRGIGWLVAKTERFIRNRFTTARGLKVSGTFMAFCVPALVWGVAFSVLEIAGFIHPLLYHLLNILMLYTTLSVKSLGYEVGKVHKALRKGDIVGAQKALSYLVSRETKDLDDQGIIRAAVETVAENTVDGVISPLFYAFLGGAPLAMCYKAINTLDSMVGYKNEKYIHLGWASARLDDLANFIPARLAGLIIPLASGVCGFHMFNSFRIVLRDRRNHASPNAGFPEAAVAGALGVQLGGESTYFGKKIKKPTLGDPMVPLEPKHIKAGIRIMYTVATIMVTAGFLISRWV
ncbi:adenosylcobinamide-phosphate synthase CbiB [Thermovirga lienii]|uniref:adenosylcobinamide-phosphate synthase CbiB n=1 Tax=Thermovirga lienii TaxID=336261 RepID=UPI000EEACBAF|nr:cobalamin biosynthesis protein CobD [Thermovirga lienii]